MELTLDQVLQKGVEAHKAGKVQEADQYYTAVLKANPKHPDANHNMGVLAVGVGKVEQAIPFFKTALESNPSIVQFWLSYVGTLIKLDRVHDARIVLDQAKSKGVRSEAFNGLENSLNKRPGAVVSKVENPPQDQLETLISLYNQGQTQPVLDQALKLLNEFPSSTLLHNICGAVNVGLQKYDEAVNAYKQAIIINPNYPNAYNNMGVALKEQGKLEEAIESYKKALAIKPDNAEAYYNIGNALKEQGKLEEAIEAYNKALAIKPNYADASNNLGLTFQDQGKLEEAIHAYNEALAIKPDNADAYNNLGNAFKEQGKLEEAMEAYNKALAIKSDNAIAKHMLASLTGDTSEIAPRQYVENLFDGYSRKFEADLVNKLKYMGPKLIRDILIKPNDHKVLGSVLDLGCGTGLLGPEIKDYCSKLEGIDLSSKMLKLAKQKNIYDNLNHMDILEYLSRMPLDFDYYIAADVFVYIGNLTEIFQLIKSRNKKSGNLVFSTEHTELEGYHILESGRYSHSKSYIESLCKKFGYKISHFSTSALRKEKNSILTGGIYVLSF